MTDLQATLESEFDARIEAEAEAAAERIKRGQHWSDWVAIGKGLVVGRHRAMARAGTNQPTGAIYNRGFGEWMDAHKWARDLDKATRNHAMWCADHLSEIERWRELLATNQRAMINHPTTTKRRFEALHKDKADKPAGETKAQRIERELDAAISERDKWRKMAEADGSLFDLKKDSVASIVKTISASVSDYRLAELAKALAAECARVKAAKKQAG
jgi:hypothetical protein